MHLSFVVLHKSHCHCMTFCLANSFILFHADVLCLGSVSGRHLLLPLANGWRRKCNRFSCIRPSAITHVGLGFFFRERMPLWKTRLD